MSGFKRAAVEIEALERRVAELERLGRGKDAELTRLRQPDSSSSSSSAETIFALLEEPRTVDSAAALAKFVDQHQSLANGLDLLPQLGQERYTKLVLRVVSLLLEKEEKDTATSFTFEVLRLAKGLYRESAPGPLQRLDLYLRHITPSAASTTREEAAKCMNNVLFNNCQLRDASIAGEVQVDALLLLLQPVAEVIASPLVSSNGEARLLVVVLKALFQASQGDDVVARLLVKSGVLRAVISRLADAFLEVQRETAIVVDDTNNTCDLVSGTHEALARGQLLIDGFRWLYILANFAQEDVLASLLANDGVPPLRGDALEQGDLALPSDVLGMGDRYVFLQTKVLQLDLPVRTTLQDQQYFDQIKTRVASLLMFADRASGLVPYLFRHRVGEKLVRLFYRQTRTTTTKTSNNNDDLLPLILALKTLAAASEDFLGEFQDLFFAELQPELDATQFASKQEFDEAKERRHFAGKSVPDTPFGNCVALLTSYDENLKRMAGELLYDLCDQNPDKVTKLVGFGHAAHLLAIKGGMIEQILAGKNNGA